MIIYLILNQLDGKVYVGKTTKDLATRWKAHIAAAFYEDSPFHLHRAMRKYGRVAFLPIKLTDVVQGDEDAQERHFIAKYQSNNPLYGYNMTAGGEGGWHNQYVIHPRGMLGKKHSEATRQRMSGPRPATAGANHPMFGRKHTAEARARMSAALKAARQRKFWSTRKATSVTTLEGTIDEFRS